jgi:predicted nucleic acid-binding protein
VDGAGERLKIDKSDIDVAATARALGVPLVTNDGDFAAVENVSVETYKT